MRKPKLSKITDNLGAAGIVIAEPVVIGGEKIVNVTRRRARSVRANFTEAKAAITEHREEKAQAKAMAEVQPHIDAVEAQFGVGVSPAHQHDLDAYHADLREEFSDLK